MSVSQTNYRENYFQHPSLTKITGDPTYASLAKLEKECKANGKSVRTTLGGGLQGHLGLVTSAQAYERISPGEPFVRPVLPVLPDLTQATAHQIAEARQVHTDNMEIFKACNLIERTIIQQINTAIDEACLADLIDDETGLLEGTVPQIMHELFDTYGAITPQSLTAAKAKLETTSYNHSKPIVNIFTSINEYANMADAADAPETATQLINIGLIIITRSTIFASDIRKWHSKPTVDQTWPNFKSHFKDTQKEIKRSQPAVTADTLGYHDTANTATLVDQVLDRLTAQRNAEMANDTSHNERQAQANSTQANQTMMDQMQSLITTVSSLQTQVANSGHTPTTTSNSGGHNPQSGRGRGRGGRGNRTYKYCWSHGSCGHTGPECLSKATGHIDTATFQHMQGGCTTRCHWLN